MQRIRNFLERFQNTAGVVAVKSGLVMAIPVLMIGSAALVFMYFPITEYQEFIESALDGKLIQFFEFIYNATFGMFAVFLTCTISFSYARQRNYNHVSLIPSITSLVCFFILSGVRIGDANWDALGVKGVFIAILSALIATRLLFAILDTAKAKEHGFSGDSDVEFNYSVSVILPAAVVIGAVALVNLLIVNIFNVNSLFMLLVNLANALFASMGRSFLSGLLMVLISSLLWFFGIHGSNVLESVMDNLFTPAIEENIALVAANQAPTEIFTKQFFDIFVLMGGCGTAICLLIATVVFSRRRRNRRLSRLACVPMTFNINELMVFGYPVIFNATLLVPFVLTPVFCFITTYFAMRTGLVPLTVAEVNWTAPVLLSGYMATGSIHGSLLQLFNIAVGVFIYRPFVKAYDRQCEESARKQINELVQLKINSEKSLVPVMLTELTNHHGALSRSLVSDLRYALSKESLELFYQPQYDNHFACVGAESLLRWNHPLYGMMYPPLVIQLARESGILSALEVYILRRSVAEMRQLRECADFSGKVSVNISSATLQDDGYFELLKTLAEDGSVRPGEICLEITEQTALQLSDKTFERLREIKNLGYLLAIDDFSMGHTSLAYLQENYFDIVKLDGFLISDMTDNSRSYSIVKNITRLSRELGFRVIAEYVETEKQMKMLESAGCAFYQGYLFSKALPKEQLVEKLIADKKSVTG